MLCTERHVRKGTELAQVGFDPSAYLMLVKSTVKFIMTHGIKSSKQERLFYQYLSFKSIRYRYMYMYVYKFPCENDIKPLCKLCVNFFFDSHGILHYGFKLPYFFIFYYVDHV